MAVVDVVVLQDGPLLQPRFHQPAAIQAGRFRLLRHADEQIQRISFLRRRRQIADHLGQRRGRGGQNLIGIGDVAGLHVGDQFGPLRRRRRIAPRVLQPDDQSGRIGPDVIHAGGEGDRLDQLHLLLDRSLFGFLGALRTDRRAGAARHHQRAAAGQEFPAVEIVRPIAFERLHALSALPCGGCGRGALDRAGAIRTFGPRKAARQTPGERRPRRPAIPPVFRQLSANACGDGQSKGGRIVVCPTRVKPT